MPYYEGGDPRNNIWKRVAAGASTSPISTPGDQIVGRDYLERVIITAATTAVGAVSVFDGDTALLVHNAQVTGYTGTNVYVYEIGCVANTTEGFNVTTGSSIACVCIGRF